MARVVDVLERPLGAGRHGGIGIVHLCESDTCARRVLLA